MPRFFAGAVGEGGAKGQATVGTEIAPVLLLSWKDESRSVGERALRVAAALNAAVDRARVGQPAAFEAREQPAIGVALVGAPDLLVRVTPQDAAAYETPPGLPRARRPAHPDRARPALGRAPQRHARRRDERRQAHGRRPAIGARGRAPPSRSSARRCPGSTARGLSSARVVALPGDLKRRLREAAFRVP